LLLHSDRLYIVVTYVTKVPWIRYRKKAVFLGALNITWL